MEPIPYPGHANLAGMELITFLIPFVFLFLMNCFEPQSERASNADYLDD